MCLIFHIKHCKSKNFLPNPSSFFLNFPPSFSCNKSKHHVPSFFFFLFFISEKRYTNLWNIWAHVFNIKRGGKRHTKQMDLMQLIVYSGLNFQDERRSLWTCRYLSKWDAKTVCLVEQITTKVDVSDGH